MCLFCFLLEISVQSQDSLGIPEEPSQAECSGCWFGFVLFSFRKRSVEFDCTSTGIWELICPCSVFGGEHAESSASTRLSWFILTVKYHHFSWENLLMKDETLHFMVKYECSTCNCWELTAWKGEAASQLASKGADFSNICLGTTHIFLKLQITLSSKSPVFITSKKQSFLENKLP